MNNKNHHKWLVPIEIAKKLKKIGFNEPCLVENVETHSEDYNFINFKEEMYSEAIVLLEDVEFVSNKDLEDKLDIYKNFVLRIVIPTLEQVLEWFRNKNLIGWVECQCNPEMEYYIRIVNKGVNLYLKGRREHYNSYEEACESLVNELIRIYENSI